MDCSEVTTLRVREQMKRTCDGDRKSLEHRILREATRAADQLLAPGGYDGLGLFPHSAFMPRASGAACRVQSAEIAGVELDLALYGTDSTKGQVWVVLEAREEAGGRSR